MDKRCAAVRSGQVLVKGNGGIDARSAAVRSGKIMLSVTG